MISFALILMTLPSRMAEVRAGRADQTRHGEASIARAVQGGLPDLSRGGSGGRGVRRGGRRDNSSSAAGDGGRYNKEG